MRMIFLALVLTGCGSDKADGGDTGTTPSTGSTTASTGAPTGTASGDGTGTATGTGTGTGSTVDPSTMVGTWNTGIVSPATDSCAIGDAEVEFTISNASDTGFTLELTGIPDQLDCDLMGTSWGCLPAFINESVPNMNANLSYTWTLGGYLPTGDSMEVAMIVVGECTGSDCGLFMPTSPCQTEIPGTATR